MAHHLQGGQPSSIKGIERVIVEKNRRDHMKYLFSMLNSLLPTNNIPRGGALSRVDQIDEAINYIKNLETKVKMAQEKKESLMQRKRSRSDSSSSASEAPKIEIREMGSSLQIFLTCGFDNQFIFSEIIRMLHEENIEFKSTFFTRWKLNATCCARRRTTAMSERLKRFVDGHREYF